MQTETGSVHMACVGRHASAMTPDNKLLNLVEEFLQYVSALIQYENLLPTDEGRQVPNPNLVPNCPILSFRGRSAKVQIADVWQNAGSLRGRSHASRDH